MLDNPSSSSTLEAPVEHYRFHIRESAPSIHFDLVYCPELQIRPEAISRILYRAIYTINQFVQRDGYSAPLPSGSYVTPEERGYNCLFGIHTIDGEGPISVGVVADVLVFLRGWMVRGQRTGSDIFIVWVDGVKAASGELRPIVDPVLLSD
ncbi:MAG: hypothetical protein Q9207_002491 [Kuettlingeria erythrocarpa]